MASIALTQAEADALIAMEKHRENDSPVDFPLPGEGISIPLRGANKREQFLLDVSRGQIDLRKVKYQNRARVIYVLVRLDMVGPPHRNPDDEEIPCPHLHLYREGYGDKWAFPIPKDKFPKINDIWSALEDFMRFCNITKPPNIQGSLF